MPDIHIDDRAALERVYPPEAFAADAAENSAATGPTTKGVRILHAPDRAGKFSLERGARQVGEAAEACFLAPYRRTGAAGEPGTAAGNPGAEYQSFLDDIVTAARRSGYDPERSPGRGDQRIRGLRQ